MSDYVQYTTDDYAQTISNNLPQGPLWNREPDSGLMKWAQGCAQIWADIDESANDLIFVEGDPTYCETMLPDWEACYALPDPCVTVPQTIAQRRTALLNKITVVGGSSKTFFINLAAYLGYTITITEYIPFVFGLSSFGVVGNNNAWMAPQSRYYWTVNIQNETYTRFSFGASQFGRNSFLDISLAEDLECVFGRWKPAHTIVVFNYVNN